ncbi:MAG: superoxide dismutase [Chloroflexota bacterium]|jgi:Fe-Mn family superoxide dismutase
MAFTQPELPFKLDAFKPFLSEEQMNFHYNKHHAAYFKNLNGLVEGKPEATMTLEDLIQKASGPMFNNAAQAWNHTFFWNCMSPSGGGKPSGKLAAAIDRDFGNLDAFRQAFSDAAVKLFGSGWAWLALDPSGKLEVMQGSNADNPLKHGKKPILTVDVWEHAYYVDYRNDRARFVAGFWDVIHWKEATALFEK